MMFERMKKFKEKYNKTTVPVTFEDRTLYGWYRKQKDIYNHSILKMPEEHLKKLKSIDFHFEDGHKERERIIELQWLKILKQAIKANEDIRVNHRYSFNGETLGTFLVGLKASNKNGKKLALRKEVQNTGFDFKETSRKPKDVTRRYIDELLNDENPSKSAYQTRFNSHMKKKKDIIGIELVTELNEAWELQFDEKRSWEVTKRLIDRVNEWKEFRYNQNINPTGKWSKSQKYMGDKLYSWVRKRRLDKKSLDLIIERFSDKEKLELRQEGFPI